MSKATIADVLHLAADKYLASRSYAGQKSRFSCTAVEFAADRLGVETTAIFKGLGNMGLDTTSCNAFINMGYEDNFAIVFETQAARYTWLKFAALIAEEQGV